MEIRNLSYGGTSVVNTLFDIFSSILYLLLNEIHVGPTTLKIGLT